MRIKVGREVFNIDTCNSLFSHFLGLMFKFPKNDGLLFVFEKEQKVALHMFFVFFSIDIIYINKKKEVVRIRRKIKPFTPYIPAVKCKYILELKDYRNIKVGDKITNLKYH
ncbi:MAG TPA: DUF192 domain-containing protein [Candidatus Nanoarchaeia archaeon]|nr:DUF192 domain-containing protein [Candidatus Nanoarchaeia archaeon]